ncbi:MAG: hypothetical protein IPF85_24205 [Anaerolineae bacterium]|nr:hypothetical protein [Anaerolineae bacterium]
MVHNAAVGWYGPPAQQSPDAIDELLAINLRAPIAPTHALLPRPTAARGVIARVNSVHAALPTRASPSTRQCGRWPWRGIGRDDPSA